MGRNAIIFAVVSLLFCSCTQDSGMSNNQNMSKPTMQNDNSSPGCGNRGCQKGSCQKSERCHKACPCK